MGVHFVLLWAFVVLCSGPFTSTLSAATASLIKGECKPQGLLRLDKPYPHPRRVQLPFCQQFGCSCCNASHARSLQRAARVVAEDEDLSSACKRGLLRLACRLCDPEVGTGVKQYTCRATCEQLFDDCAQDFFSYDSSSGLISPCSEQTSGMLVCSHLTDLVSTAAEFCKAAGLGVVAPPQHADEPCFDGSPVGPEACPADPPASKQQKQQQRAKQRRKGQRTQQPTDFTSRLLSMLPWKLKRQQRQQLTTVIELCFGTALAGLMAWLVVVVLQWAMKPRRRAGEHRPPANVREMLARAAEKRSREGNASKAE